MSGVVDTDAEILGSFNEGSRSDCKTSVGRSFARFEEEEDQKDVVGIFVYLSARCLVSKCTRVASWARCLGGRE
ncbi:hypothetical protein GE21DRAFT_1281353 [Neurospora crassa]|nr:hypothetical protein GE21DRAFT_1281353 [Neurospora crassa]